MKVTSLRKYFFFNIFPYLKHWLKGLELSIVGTWIIITGFCLLLLLLLGLGIGMRISAIGRKGDSVGRSHWDCCAIPLALSPPDKPGELARWRRRRRLLFRGPWNSRFLRRCRWRHCSVINAGVGVAVESGALLGSVGHDVKNFAYKNR